MLQMLSAGKYMQRNLGSRPIRKSMTYLPFLVRVDINGWWMILTKLVTIYVYRDSWIYIYISFVLYFYTKTLLQSFRSRSCQMVPSSSLSFFFFLPFFKNLFLIFKNIFFFFVYLILFYSYSFIHLLSGKGRGGWGWGMEAWGCKGGNK